MNQSEVRLTPLKGNCSDGCRKSTASWETSWSGEGFEWETARCQWKCQLSGHKLISFNNDTKNTSQTIVDLQESIFIHTEQVQKVNAERQQAEAKAKEDIASTVSTNGEAIADLKSELEDVITKIEITLKQEQTKDNSALLDRLNIVQDSTASILSQHLEEVKSLYVVC